MDNYRQIDYIVTDAKHKWRVQFHGLWPVPIKSLIPWFVDVDKSDGKQPQREVPVAETNANQNATRISHAWAQRHFNDHQRRFVRFVRFVRFMFFSLFPSQAKQVVHP